MLDAINYLVRFNLIYKYKRWLLMFTKVNLGQRN